MADEGQSKGLSDTGISYLASLTPVEIPFLGAAIQKVRQEKAMHTIQRKKAGK